MIISFAKINIVVRGAGVYKNYENFKKLACHQKRSDKKALCLCLVNFWITKLPLTEYGQKDVPYVTSVTMASTQSQCVSRLLTRKHLVESLITCWSHITERGEDHTSPGRNKLSNQRSRQSLPPVHSFASRLYTNCIYSKLCGFGWFKSDI